MDTKIVLILFVIANCMCKACAQDMPNLFDIDLYNSPMVEITGSIDVRGDNGDKLNIVEFGAQGHARDHLAVLFLSGKYYDERAVLQLGLLNDKNLGNVELNCEWKKKASNKTDHLIGLTNLKSIPKEHYLNPYKAWLVKITPSPPSFMPVKANLVHCYGGAVD